MTVLAGALLALLGVAIAAVRGPVDGAPRPLLAAHRGGALLWPENSLRAFRGAVALGADYLELDVHLSWDGHVMVIHDATLDRTTTGRGAVADHTAAELKALRLKDRSGAVTEEAMPTLGEVAAIAAAAGRSLLVELKVDAGRARYRGLEERVLAILDEHGMAASSIVMAFEADTWRRVRALRPDVRAGALYRASDVRTDAELGRAFADARAAGVAFVGLEYRRATADALARAREAGIALGAWTVNDPEAMRRAISLPIDVLITDRPDVARELIDQRRSP